MDRLIVFAPNVGGGGGLVLLRELLNATWPAAQIIAILDLRGRKQMGDLPADITPYWVTSTLRGRWHAERLLARISRQPDFVLCFHNLPPMARVSGTICCYVQNANLVGIIPTSSLRGWVRLRYAVERFIARWFRHKIDRYIVQTPTMAEALSCWYGPGAPPIDVLPFGAAQRARPASPAKLGDNARFAGASFIYVSDGSLHKNHPRLFAAWRMLAQQGMFPRLAVTLHPARDAILDRDVAALAADGLKVENLGLLSHAKVLDAYRHYSAMIFPSVAESFGIPLLEATQAGLPILAPELDYVRDVCVPAATFDPSSPRSIARAVHRFLSGDDDSVQILTADGFAYEFARRVTVNTAAGF